MEWRQVISSTILENKDRLNNLSKEIWTNPENSFEEVHAHQVLTHFLSEEGFELERNYLFLTGFKASYGTTEAACGGAHVCFTCEYDAVPGMGHAAGHNLCSEASIAAALAIKQCIQDNILIGKVTILGCPAENSCGGTKIDMINKGAFETVDFAMMLCPLNYNIVAPAQYLLVTVTVTYKGKAAHASAFPWEGRNALDAAVSCYSNVALLRAQLRPTQMVNGIITKGGVQANLIPDSTELKFWLRAPTHQDLVHIQQKCQACFIAAAKATGCEADFDFADKQYFPMQHNMKLGELYKLHAEEQGITFPLTEDPDLHTGSTDMGNVSQVVPCINPTFDIGTKSPHYSRAFHDATGTDEAHENTLKAATAIAMTAAQVLSDTSLLDVIKSEYVTFKSSTGRHLLVLRSSSQTMNLPQ